MHHMQQEFQVLTAKIGGLEGKKSNMKPPGEQRLINSLISHKVQMKWLNLELCKKKKKGKWIVNESDATQPAGTSLSPNFVRTRKLEAHVSQDLVETVKY